MSELPPPMARVREAILRSREAKRLESEAWDRVMSAVGAEELRAARDAHTLLNKEADESVFELASAKSALLKACEPEGP